jgi:hypothetical protein
VTVDGRLLVSHDGPAWLPAGGRADVVLAGRSATLPEPTCLVRLLVTRDGQMLVVPRRDGRGLDIPTQTVVDGAADHALVSLVVATLGDVRPTALLGYVRNAVPAPSDDYPWPAPDAYFAVWPGRRPRTKRRTLSGWIPLAPRSSWGSGTGGRSLPRCSADLMVRIRVHHARRRLAPMMSVPIATVSP